MRKRLLPHLLFVLAAAACVYLPFLLMYLIGAGPAAYILFYLPPFTLVPGTALALGLCAGKHLKRYWYVPVLVPLCFLFSIYGQICPLEMLVKLLALYLLPGAGGMMLCHFIRKFIRLRQGEPINEKDL